MQKNQELYDFLLAHSPQLTEDWYNSVEDNDPESMYVSSDTRIINELKEQNQDYFLHFYKIFIKDENYLYSDFKRWSENIAKDPKHLDTPLHYVVREYMKCQEIVLKYIKRFILLQEDRVEMHQIFSWYDITVKAFNLSIGVFIEEYHKNTSTKLLVQKKVINELSSPIIKLQNNTALLPLVGDIDTARAKLILENTLSQCASQGIAHLFIDLSGVAIIDTMVADQIFNIIKALKLLGVTSTLSGIRPEIAQTAIQLGLSFENMIITSSLSQALHTVK
ncbi:STAS domain-containing protein [Aneurinibacillus sp. REN35]|uniref:STAS domain-containing protein n=1 Tax=Aneurinibacillus sp. REN35 TaxID=3237286 RepID=UPI003527AFC3